MSVFSKSITLSGIFTENMSLLEELEAKGETPHFMCRDGYCGSCKVRIKDGEVDEIKEIVAFIDEDNGERLACSCKRITENITVEYNV